MNRHLSMKLGAIALLIVLLLIPLLMISGMIRDRQALRDGVVQDIARSSSFSQRVSGPILVVPFSKKVRTWKTREDSSERYLQETIEQGRLYFLPERLDLATDVRTEPVSRGIYQARLYHADNHFSGYFELPAQLGVERDFADYSFEAPFIAVGISDIRGIGAGLALQLDGQTLAFEPGSQVGRLGAGVHARLPALNTVQGAKLAFNFDLALQGTEQLQVMPVGRNTGISMKSDWPHPSFIGNFLPAERSISADGFSARWQTSFYATNLQQTLGECLNAGACDSVRNTTLGVSFVDPVDQYLKSDRAIKYALLFVALTFAGFFLFEVLKKLAVHPVQYALVGVALAVFYLLLLSLSEHIGFTRAYLFSALACVALIGFYVCHVLRSRRHGLGFALGLAALYGLLFGLLSAEDYALLMGSLLLFGLLGVFMVLTRRLDWYGVGRGLGHAQ